MDFPIILPSSLHLPSLFLAPSIPNLISPPLTLNFQASLILKMQQDDGA